METIEVQEQDHYETKPAYSYDQYTREYIGETVADPSPLEPGVWLLPAHACYEKPPETGANEKAVLTDDGWVIMKDFRGQMYEKATGNPVLFRDFGDVPDTLTAIPKPSDLYVWSNDGWVVDQAAQHARYLALARTERDRLITYATLRINPLQDEVDNDEATSEDIALLSLWKKYRAAVGKVETKPGWPENPQWPVPPVPLEVNKSEEA